MAGDDEEAAAADADARFNTIERQLTTLAAQFQQLILSIFSETVLQFIIIYTNTNNNRKILYESIMHE